MPTTPEIDVRYRAIEGCNRSEDARIGDPASWWSTQNKYGRAPSILATRPGTRLAVNGTHQTQDSGVNPKFTAPWMAATSNPKNPSAAALAPGESYQSFPASAFTHVNSLSSSVTGTHGSRPRALTAFLPGAKIANINAGVNISGRFDRVAGLHRLYMDEGTTRRWVAAWNMGDGDRLGYVKETELGMSMLNGDGVQLMAYDGISSVGANFYFTPFKYQHPAAVAGQNYYAIGTNQLNQPFTLKNGAEFSPASNYDVEVGNLTVASSTDWGSNDTPGTDTLPTTVQRMHGVRAMCVFNGVMVYAGFRMQALPAAGTQIMPAATIYDNCVIFADLGTPHKLAINAGVLSYLRVGDTEAEGCTACCTSVIETDQVGSKNQLIVFTNRRIWVFDGTPPQTGVPLGGNFFSNMDETVGCNAPRSVVQSPYGVIFLGTDGIVYLIPKGSHGQKFPISRKIAPVFRALTPMQQNNVAAYWDSAEGYYKMSVPPVGNSTPGISPLWKNQGPVLKHPVPEIQWWADMRSMSVKQFDFGVRWFGPMVGMKHSCFAQALGSGDSGEVLAGSAVDGCLFECNRYDLATDPIPGEPIKTRQIDCMVATASRDEGDAHRDKRLQRISLGVGADRRVNIQSKLIVSGPQVNDEQGEQFDRVVVPAGPVLGLATQTGSGYTITLGATALTPPDDITLYTEQPGRVMLGKTFRAEIRERAAFVVSPTGDPVPNYAIDFVANSVTYAATVPALPGGTSYSGAELAAAMQVAMRALVGGTTITVSYAEPDGTGTSGFFTLTYSGAGNFQLLCATGVNTLVKLCTLIGCNGTDKTGALTYSSDFRPMDSYPPRVSYSDLQFTFIPSQRRSP